MAHVRPYRPADRNDVYDICVKTGKSGQDATGWLERDDLLPDIYALPYVDLQPETAFVVDTGERVSGYILGAPDTRAFVEQLRQQWLPAFTAKYELTGEATTTQHFVREGRDIDRMLIPELIEYPAHLHIDLLPELQGQGFGRILMRILVAALTDRGVPGVWLGYAPENTNAAAFYRRLGFTRLPGHPEGTTVGLRTDTAV